VILVDTSIWIDHLHAHDSMLGALLEAREVLGHRYVRGELACGHLRERRTLLRRLPQALVATDGEVMDLIERHRLMGRGLGYVDAHLLAATILTPDARLWTRDRNLAGIARSLGLEAELPGQHRN
jgi:predicted nucleic acid-binding protein